MSWSRIRRIVQLISFVAFLGLTLAGLTWGADWVPGSLFSRLDPLVGLSSIIASRTLMAFWALSLVTLALTVALGRAWCGWACPVGTLVELLPSRHRTGLDRISPRWQMGKYVVLAVVLGAAALGSLGPMILDPITIITRPLQEIVRPYMGGDAVSASVGVNIARQAVHVVAFLSLLPLIIVLAFNAVDRRFWCRSLCPLGGLLAIVSLSPGVRRQVREEKCTSCGRCSQACPTQAINPTNGWKSSTTECLSCMSCVDACPTGASCFPLIPASEFNPPYLPDRRAAVMAIGATGAGLAVSMLPRAGKPGVITRPPSTTEDRLSELCVRCGACYAVCPTGILRPSMSFTSVAGPWTPMLDERPAYCTMNCNRCARVCPTDALHLPDAEESAHQNLGQIASVHRGMCKAWWHDSECMLCQSACPIAGALTGKLLPGHTARVPVVDKDLCVGCNLCSKPCPTSPKAISVRSDRGLSLPM
jgi:ferredoxin